MKKVKNSSRANVYTPVRKPALLCSH